MISEASSNFRTIATVMKKPLEVEPFRGGSTLPQGLLALSQFPTLKQHPTYPTVFIPLMAQTF